MVASDEKQPTRANSTAIQREKNMFSAHAYISLKTGLGGTR